MFCPLCEEEVLPTDEYGPINGNGRAHQECLFRAVAGSVTHVRRECHYYGGTKDCHACEEGMTKRQAAEASLHEYRKQSGLYDRYPLLRQRALDRGLDLT